MKKLKLLLMFLVAGLSANAQNHQLKIYSSDHQEMILILNKEVIGGIDLLQSIPPKQIQQSNIDREERLSSKENLFPRSNEKAGIVFVKTDFDLETRTQEELNEFFGLNANNELYVNGFLLENKEYKIASKSIAKVEVIEPDNVFLDKSVLNITIK